MRKVFLDDLPRWGKGKNAKGGAINWRECVRHKVYFVYDDLEGEFEIINYNATEQKLTIKYLNKPYKIRTGDFGKNKIGRIIGKRTGEFKIDVGTKLKDEKRDLIVIDKEYREFQRKPNEDGMVYMQKDKYYMYKCNDCGYEGWMVESLLIKRNDACPCCSNKVVVPEINSIWKTDRWMCDLGISEEDAKKYTKFSGERIKVRCPDCGGIKAITISNIAINKSIRCICGNTGFSYPEKLMYFLLKDLNLNFETQLTKNSFQWCGNYRYDFYLTDYNIIIETHGKQHYEDNRSFKLSLKEEQKNDKIKRELALNNGVDKYIEINCCESNLEWIKESVMKSELSNLFDLYKLNWNELDKLATSNFVKRVCDYWKIKKNTETASDLEKMFGISAVTIREYLKRGSKLGWCNYDAIEELKKNYVKNGERNRLRCNKKVEVFKDNISLGVFESCSKLDRISEEIFGVKFSSSSISMVCNGRRKHHKGFTFKYID